MEMVIINSSPKELAKKIEEDNNWLNRERLEYIVEKKPDVFSYIKLSLINTEQIKKLLVNKKWLMQLANIVIENKKLIKNKEWYNLIAQSIPQPLDNIIFKEKGILLNFIDEIDYAQLGKKWLKTTTQKDFIPVQLQKYLTCSKVLNIINPSIKLSSIPENTKTKEVCLAFIEQERNSKQYQWQNRIYNSLPISLRDDQDIAYILCKNNKPFYRNLTLKAQSNDYLIMHVTDNVIYPQADTMPFETDYTAITIKELPIEVVRTIKDINLIKKVFDNQYAKFYLDEELQNKWFTKNNKKEFKKYLQYFPMESEESIVNELKKQPIKLQAAAIVQTLRLAKLIIDKNNPQHALSLLYYYHEDGDFKESIKRLDLIEVIENNLNVLIDTYKNNYKEPKMYLEETYLDEKKSLMLGIWLFKQKQEKYTQAVCELLAPIVKKQNTILDDFDVDHTLYDAFVLKKNAMKVYEYIDQNSISKTKKNKPN